jgi:quinol monooxygenase YgiN
MRLPHVTVLIRLRLDARFREEGRRDLIELARRVRQEEPDCLSIEMAQDLDDPTHITMIEHWSSREAYEGPHMQSAHMRSFIERASHFFEGPPEISFCQGTQITDGGD